MSKKINNKEVLNDEQEEVRRFIIILSALIVIIIFIFVFTKYAINDGDIRIPEQSANIGQVDNSVVTVGTMFNKGEDEYYVLAFDSSDSDNIYYTILNSEYSYGEDSLPVYFLDLNNELNKKYIATDEKPENVDAETVSEISLGEVTLIKFEDNKIEEYYNTKESISDILVVNKD